MKQERNYNLTVKCIATGEMRTKSIYMDEEYLARTILRLKKNENGYMLTHITYIKEK